MNCCEITHFHLFCGLGGGARGFNNGHARVGSMSARFRCLGGVDSDQAAIRDFERLAGAPGTVLDLFDRDQYIDWHGQEPPPEWREAIPADLRQAAGGERPDIVFTSPPCKGFSGLLSQRKSASRRYQALNRLTVRGVWLALEAWADDPPAFFILENVPRITSRGDHLLEQIEQLLERYGYATARTTHDCGELGGLAQRRKRFLLVARHTERVPPFLYEPPHRPLRHVGQVLERFPLPGDQAAGAMHTLPALHWKTWIRLALIEAGRDWRCLQDLAIVDGHLRDYRIVPCNDPTHAGPVLDPRRQGHFEYGQYGVRSWTETAGAVSGQSAPGGGRYSIADPRVDWHQAASRNKFRVVRWDQASGTIIGATAPSTGALRVADPRPGISTHNGYQTAGHYGIVSWSEPTGAVVGKAKHDTGRFNVADPRIPEPNDQLVAVIQSLDGTWHRPFTTLELAALQGLVEPDEHLVLEGTSSSAWRERIGNAVPPPAAAAIASVMGTAILLARAGETFALGATPIWVRNLAIAASVDSHRSHQ